VTVGAASAHASAAGGDLEGRLRALEDRAAIGDVVIRFAYGLDRADWDLYGSTLADELFVDFTESTGMEPRVWTRDEWCAFAAEVLEGFESRQHISSNQRIELRGDRATCLSYMYAQHHLPGAPGGDDLLMRGWYEYELTRTTAGWKIDRLTQHYTWGTGNESIFDASRARRAAGARG
jgi:SnoaL-like domain